MIRKPRNLIAITTILLLFVLFISVQAGQPAVWETSGRTELLKGDARGVSISSALALCMATSCPQNFSTR